ncbi:DUF3916 domain-containing protein [Fictibacillus phosphorivorans]|nr:DUF3916 domain-containing protein [Fictibacillus phosphorivorans]
MCTRKRISYLLLFHFTRFINSVVIISYTKAGLHSFYEGLNHNGEFLKNYSVTENSHFLQEEWGLLVPKELKVRGYDGVGEHEGYSFWLIGDID